MSIREKLADVQHGIWVHWMAYLFSCSTTNLDGSVTIPAEKVERWKRQMNTTYTELTNKEQDSDREQADKTLLVISGMNDVVDDQEMSSSTEFLRCANDTFMGE